MSTSSPNSASGEPRFREDLRIRERADGEVEIEDPRNGACYAFDTQTLALFRYFDGERDCARIAADFSNRFGTQLGVDDVESFRDDALARGLIELASASALRRGDRDGDADQEPDAENLRGEERWTLFNPARFFGALDDLLAPARPLFLLLTLALVVLVPLALYTLFDNQALMDEDLARLGQSSSYFGRLFFSLMLINLLRCLVQGTLIAHYGGTVGSFGVQLYFGMIPRFSIDRRAIRDFNRSAQLWTWGSNLLFRLVLVVVGTLMWIMLRGTGGTLSTNALVLAHAGLIGFLLVSIPMRASDGYHWFMTWRRLPLNTLKLALRIFAARLGGKPLPTSIKPGRARLLLFYALLLVVFWSWAFTRILTRIAEGLIDSFPRLFGEATEVIILLTVALLMLRWVLRKLVKSRGGTRAMHDDFGESAQPEVSGSWIRRYGSRLIAFAALVLLLLVPVPYRPGGALTLLPPEQQAIQAPVSGKVTEVFQRGGDGALLEAGDTIALMVADELEQQMRSLQEEVREQTAALAQRRARLAQILAGSRPEEIAEARARLDRSSAEVRIAEQQLETARTRSQFSDRELERMHSLPEGLISEIDIARSEKQAAVDRLSIPEQQTQILIQKKSLDEAAAQLQRLVNGATEEEVEIARQEVTEAEAALRRLEQALEHAQTQLSGTRLRMPFNGYVVDAYLNQKVGLYLSQGTTFATAQAESRPVVEMVLPESEVGAIEVGAVAEIRLLAYPEHPFSGRVVAIEPTGSASTFGQTFNVMIELLDTGQVGLKPGMSGYGKIESGRKPLYIQLSRPLMRFATIEVWSWIP